MPAVPRISTTCSAFSTAKSASSRRPTRKARRSRRPRPRFKPGQKYYQLTHDYLVPSLRDWLTRKQKETRRGRAELLLADRAAVWNARPENRQLPSLLQWLQIRWLTQKKNWTPPQRKMMAKGGPVSCGAGVGGGRLS